MASVVISGDTSGAITLAVPAVAGTNTITLPALTGTPVIAGQNSAITADTSKNASGTSVDFTGIPSWVKRITLMFNGVSTNGTSNHRIQLGDAGGIETTGYASACTFSGASTGGTSSTTGFVTTSDISTASEVTGFVVFCLFSANTWISSGNAIYNKSSISAFTMTNSGVKTLSDTLTQIRVTTVNGTDTFDAGTINILYE
jgi:hypothetical protein